MLPRRTSIFYKFVFGIVFVLGLSWPGGLIQAQANEPPTTLWVNLPAVVVELAADGTPTIGGLPLSNYVSLLGPDLAGIRVQPAAVAALTEANIQHIQVANTPNGLLIRVNGELVPSLGWSEQSLQGMIDTLAEMGAQVELLNERVLPLLESTRMRVVIYLPRDPEKAVIPLSIDTEDSAARRAEAALANYRATVGVSPHLRAELYYRPDGDFELAGVTGEQFTRMGLRLQALLTLAPGTVRRVSELGIHTIALTTEPEGVFLAINGRTLPHLIWGEGAMQHLLALTEQTEILEQIGLMQGREQIWSALADLLPMVQSTRLELVIHFPVLGD